VQCRCPVQRGCTPVSLIAVCSRSLAPAPDLLANVKTTTFTEQPHADSEAFRTDDELTTSGDAGEARTCTARAASDHNCGLADMLLRLLTCNKSIAPHRPRVIDHGRPVSIPSGTPCLP
jgi:hypothetical protein